MRSNGFEVFEVVESNFHSLNGFQKSVWLICFTDSFIYGLFTLSGITRLIKTSKPSKLESVQYYLSTRMR